MEQLTDNTTSLTVQTNELQEFPEPIVATIAEVLKPQKAVVAGEIEIILPIGVKITLTRDKQVIEIVELGRFKADFHLQFPSSKDLANYLANSIQAVTDEVGKIDLAGWAANIWAELSSRKNTL